LLVIYKIAGNLIHSHNIECDTNLSKKQPYRLRVTLPGSDLREVKVVTCPGASTNWGPPESCTV